MRLWKELLEDAREALRENPWIGRGIVGIVVMLALMCALPGVMRSMRPQRQADVAAMTDAQTVEMTDEQSRISGSYDEATEAFVETLEQGAWCDTSGRRVTFTDDSYSIDGSDPKPYAVSAVKEGKPQTDTFTDNVTVTSTTTQTTATLLLEDGTSSIATLTVTKGDEGTTRTLECDALGSKAFSADESSVELTLDAEGHDEQLASAVGGSVDALTAKVRAWASDECPAASMAVWDGRVTSDYAAGTTELTLTLNDQRSTEVEVRYYTETGALDVRGGDE